MNEKDLKCNYYGCIYNVMGVCDYSQTPIQIPYYQACRQNDLDSVHADLYGD